MAGQGFVSRTTAVVILLGCLILGVLIGLSPNNAAVSGGNLRSGNVEQRRVDSLDKPAEDKAAATVPKGLDLPAGGSFPSLMYQGGDREVEEFPAPSFEEWQDVWKNNKYFNVLDDFDFSFSFSYEYDY